MHVIVVTPIPTPYRDPFWESFSQCDGVRVTVIYCATGKTDRPWSMGREFSYCRMFPSAYNLASWFGWGQSCYWNPDISHLLATAHPDIVLVGGYNHPTMLRAVRYCRRHRLPWLLMTESWRTRSRILESIKAAGLKLLVREAAGALPTGQLASRRLVELGIPLERQCLLPNVPDVEGITSMSAQCQDKRIETRTSLSLPAHRKLIVFAGRMIPKKRPMFVLRQYLELRNAGKLSDASLVMVGDGPLRKELNREVAISGCEDVIFTGFLSPTDVIRTIAVSNLFVLPSSETWGVAPIEALSCGIPVILSDQTGCSVDVLFDQKLGTAIEIDQPSRLQEAMIKYLANDVNPQEVRSKWAQRSDQFKYSSLAKRLHAELQKVLCVHP